MGQVNRLKGQSSAGVLSLLDRKTGNVGVELGVASGSFSLLMTESGAFSHFFGVDAYADHHDIGEYKEAVRRIGLFAKYTLLRMTFHEALDLFPDASLDLIYIDGYADTGQEGGDTIYAWASKVRLGGVIAGHDYSPIFPLTMDAVDRFAADTGFDLHYTDQPDDRGPYPSWAFIKTSSTPLQAPRDMARRGQKAVRRFKRRVALRTFAKRLLGRR